MWSIWWATKPKSHRFTAEAVGDQRQFHRIVLAGKVQDKGNCSKQHPHQNKPISSRISRLHNIFHRPPTLAQINCQDYKNKNRGTRYPQIQSTFRILPQAASDLLLPTADSSLFCYETAEQQLYFNFTSTSPDIQFSVLHEASSEVNFSQELMWLWCDSLCSIWIKHFLLNSKFSSREGLSGIWDRGAIWIKVTVFKFLSNFPLPTHTYLHIFECTYLHSCKSNTKILITALSNSFSALSVIEFLSMGTFRVQTPKSLHGQIFGEVQMHTERFLSRKDRHRHT